MLYAKSKLNKFSFKELELPFYIFSILSNGISSQKMYPKDGKLSFNTDTKITENFKKQFKLLKTEFIQLVFRKVRFFRGIK